MITITVPGVYAMDMADYHRSEGVSKSMLDYVHECPALLEWSRKAPVDETADTAVSIGTAFHTLLLEPERFERDYVLDFKPPRGALTTKDDIERALAERGIAYKTSDSKPKLAKLLLDHDPEAPVADALAAEWEKGINGRIVLSAAEGHKLHLMRDSVMAHPYARRLIEMQGDVEQCHYWVDGETGELCRARMDKTVPMLGAVVDVKSSADAGKRAFARSVEDFRYFVQDAFYSDGFTATMEPCRAFLFLVVATTRDRARYPVHVYSLPAEQRELGRREYRADLAAYAQAKRTGRWHGVEALSLSDWFLKQQQLAA